MIRGSWNKRTEEEIKGIVENFGYFLIEQYSNEKSQKRVVVRDNDGYKYDVDLHSLNKYVPSLVGKNNPFSLENIKLFLKLTNSNLELLDNNVFISAQSKLNFYCNKCKDYPLMSWANLQSGFGCGICHGKQIGLFHNLENQNPSVASEWNYKLNDKTPKDFKVSSGISVFWLCRECGYGKNGEWFVSIDSRTNGSGCPSCSGNVLSDKNRLSIIFPDVAKEWHPIKNGNLTPDDVPYGTSKKVWWLCNKGHEYCTSVNSKTNSKNGCNQCWQEQNESYLADYLKKYFTEKYDSKTEYKIFKNPKTGASLRYDIYIPYGESPAINGFYIEIHGQQHYSISGWVSKMASKKGTNVEEEFEYKKYLDKIKKEFAKKNGTYIEIDIRKFEQPEKAIFYIENILEKNLFYE